MAYYPSVIPTPIISVGLVDPTIVGTFIVRIDGENMGQWQNVDGLDMQREVEKYREGGTNGWEWQFPKGITYSDITLKRGYVYNDSMERLVDWFTTGVTSGTVVRKNFTVEIWRKGQIAPHTEIDVFGAFPIKFSVSSLDITSDSVFVEEMTLTHQGYTFRNEYPMVIAPPTP